jgi:hypothetical protein
MKLEGLKLPGSEGDPEEVRVKRCARGLTFQPLE